VVLDVLAGRPFCAVRHLKGTEAMLRQFPAMLAVAVTGVLALGACSGDSEDPAVSQAGDAAAAAAAAASPGRIGVILPDSATSARWVTADQPFLENAFKRAGVGYEIQNAQGDKARFQAIAEKMIASGVRVLLITNLDNESGAAVIRLAASARIPVIDYDRLTLGGGAKYYVSFDNVAVGTTIGQGLLSCLKAADVDTGGVVEMNGSPDDNNATLFKQGYDKAIRQAGFDVVADHAVPAWNNSIAGLMFEQAALTQKGKFVAVAAANDGLAGAVVSVLQRNGLAGEVLVSGQDATDEGLQRILLGTQCNTVYKAVKKEADAASRLAIALATGDAAGADALASDVASDIETGAGVKSILLQPQGITKKNVKDVIADGYTTKEKVCTTPKLQQACAEAGIP
jgi:D-xylose transport system substrate-binding protein